MSIYDFILMINEIKMISKILNWMIFQLMTLSRTLMAKTTVNNIKNIVSLTVL